MGEVSKKILYEGKADWGKKSRYEEVVSPLPSQGVQSEPGKDAARSLIGNFGDLTKKAEKISAAVEDILHDVTIPVDPGQNPEVYAAVKMLDPSSKGLFITFALYKRILSTLKQVSRKVKLDTLSESIGSGILGNSEAIRRKLLE